MSALQKQLAAIAATSSKQLDLKAQRAAHGQSLLFPAKVAVSQDFETIYHICLEGFQELCALDPRFNLFANSLFGEESKSQDRGQMTVDQIKELDVVIQRFLGLASSSLLLKPAQKSVEWLVRRFRVHENNTEDVLLAFLPYHSTPIFTVLLSIVPSQITPTFRFLRPYVNSSTNPPSHAIIHAATNTKQFFSAFNSHMIRVARNRHQSPMLLSFWCSIASQSLEGILFASQSGIPTTRRQRLEDALLQILPVLNDSLSIKDVPEMAIGACMLTTILASRSALGDNVIAKLMDEIAVTWTPSTVDARLISLAALAQEMSTGKLSRAVTKRLVELPDLISHLATISQSFKVDKLTAGLALRCIDRLPKSREADLELIQRALESRILKDKQVVKVLTNLFDAVSGLLKSGTGDVADEFAMRLRNTVSGIVASLSKSRYSSALSIAQCAAEDLTPLESLLQISSVDDVQQSEDVKMEDAPLVSPGTETSKILSFLPDAGHPGHSFLETPGTSLYRQLAQTFRRLSDVDGGIKSFVEHPALREKSYMTDPTFLTFMISVASSDAPSKVRISALDQIKDHVGAAQSLGTEFHVLLPYLLPCLSDQSASIRQSAAEVVSSIASSSGSAGTKAKTWGSTSLYSQASEKRCSLSKPDATAFCAMLLTSLQELAIDPSGILKVLKKSLSKSKSKSDFPKHDLSTKTRDAIIVFIAMHAVETNLLRVKIALLEFLSSMGKASSNVRSEVVIPALGKWLSKTAEDAELLCNAQGVRRRSVLKAFLSCITAKDGVGAQYIAELLSGGMTQAEDLKELHSRVIAIWPSLGSEHRSNVLKTMLETGSGPATGDTQSGPKESLSTLRSLPLLPEDLAYLLELLPNASPISSSRASKRRRVSRNESAKFELSPHETMRALEKYAVVLEIIEASGPELQLDLLSNLFSVLGELQNFGIQTDSNLGYLKTLTVNSLLSTVDKLKDTREPPKDPSVVRIDLLIDTIRTTSNAQLQNSSLLLVSCLAMWLPDAVLHSVMPVFTFMGSTLLRQGDDYSAHVIDQTVSRVVPPLVASLKKRSREVVPGVVDVLISFTAAFEHIPTHRRLSLFEHVANALGPSDCLYAVVIMILDRYPTDQGARNFARDLLNLFDTDVALSALGQCLALMTDALQPRRELSDVLLNVKEKSTDQIYQSVDDTLQALSHLSTDPKLRSRITSLFQDVSDSGTAQQTAFSDLMRIAIRLTQQAKNSVCAGSARRILTEVFKLLPTVDLVQCAEMLLEASTDDIREIIISSIGSQSKFVKQSESDAVAALLGFVERVTAVLGTATDDGQRYSAIICIDQIAVRFGKKDPSKILPAARMLVGEHGIGSNTGRIQITALLTLASMVDILREDMLEYVPSVMQRCFQLLAVNAEAQIPKTKLHSAAFAVINSITEHLPFILSGAMLDSAFRAAQLATEMKFDEGDDFRDQFYSTVARQIGAGEAFSLLQRSYAWAKTQSYPALQDYYSLVKHVVELHSKRDVLKHSSTLFQFIGQAFELRACSVSPDVDIRVTLEEAEELEVLAIDIALAHVLKINDVTLRPFFVQLVEWTSWKTKEPQNSRISKAITLFRFLKALLAQLKALVTGYMTYVLELVTDVLQRPPDEDAGLLLLTVLDVLAEGFKYDEDEFWQSPTNFDAVAEPLLAQLSRPIGSLGTSHAIAAITGLASAASSQDHHKAINSGILKLMRSDSSATRLTAVKCQRSLTDRLGEEWLTMLPEMLPFITDLLEDDEEKIERETRAWIRTAEEILGENLENMLQ